MLFHSNGHWSDQTTLAKGQSTPCSIDFVDKLDGKTITIDWLSLFFFDKITRSTRQKNFRHTAYVYTSLIQEIFEYKIKLKIKNFSYKF